MDEFGLIRRYFARAGGDGCVRVGIGDDAAVMMMPEPGNALVAATDTLVEGVHFPVTLDAWHVGWRAVMVNVSDFAAMGARPRWMTLALTLREADPDWLEGFAAGMFEAASRYGVALVGGDTTSGSQIVASLQVMGDVPPGRALLRSGARPGDTIYVTGTPGDAAAGLDEFESKDASPVLRERFMKPEARVEYGLALRDFATAAIDVSDGLYADLDKLLIASGCGGELYLDRLPLSAALQERYSRDRQLEFALSGGDDYELCFTGPAAAPPAADLPVTAIGKVVRGKGIACTEDGRAVKYADKGFLHFK
ncbi:MAG: thiamine-phosphate kinase [Woeseiaceae bacterium]|nr:thiamine-phosphate kinase [Woeseiaceae bacterium]